MPKKKTVKQKKQTVQKKIKPVITSKTMKTKTKRKPAQSKTVAPVKKAPSKKVNLREFLMMVTILHTVITILKSTMTPIYVNQETLLKAGEKLGL